MRRIAALVVAGGILLTAAACSSTPTRASCGPVDQGGTSSQLITASGDFGSKPLTLSFPTPLVGDKDEVSVISAGTGPLIEKGDFARYTITAADSATGKPEGSETSGYQASDTNGPVAAALECATVGSRIALYVPGDATSSSAVAVIDVQSAFKGKADGVPQLPQAGLPEVVTAPDGTPGITVANLPIPDQVRSEVTKAGSGAVVKAGDSVVMQYTVFSWTATTGSDGVVTREASVGKTTWGTSVPLSAVAGPWNATAGTGFFPGTEKALLDNVKVGSQVLVVVPPKDSFTGGTGSDDAADDGVASGATRVYVIDILEATAPTN